MKIKLTILLFLGLFGCDSSPNDPRNIETHGNETVSYYEEHPEILKAALAKCAESKLAVEQKNFCSTARKAQRNIKAQKTLDSVNKKAFPD